MRANPWVRVKQFLDGELAPGIALLAATVVAMAWANVAPGSYHDVWHTTLDLPGPAHPLTLQEWVSGGLMAVFFFVVGLEIKREARVGELRDPRAAAVPISAAVGGMIVPAAFYALVTHGTDVGHGWGIPMATDIAFALAVLRLAGRHVRGLPVTLLTLAVVDDLGAILVIALFYSAGISAGWLLVEVAVVAAVLALGRMVEHPAWFVVPAVIAWIAIERSGVHATVAGVLLGLVTPLHGRNGRRVLEPLEHRLRPWTDFLVLPAFALANTGVVITIDRLRATVSSPITAGIALGLIVGKLVGIMAGAHVALRAGGRLPEGMTRRALIALGLLGGIGFTVSLFVAGLSFSGPDLDIATLAILGASLVATVLAALTLRRTPAGPGGAIGPVRPESGAGT
jgi:NhaA family Na+:H+ antiporter